MLRTRYLRILRFFAGILLGLLWWDILLPKIGLRRLTNAGRAERFRRIAVRFRGLAIEMGGVMIKVGQFLSSRLDVLPKEITDELAGLQDEVRPVEYELIRQVIETEFGVPVAEKYAEFDPHPLASASIGQVHRARLRRVDCEDCPSVVVKVQRPNIEAIVNVDLAALKVVSGWINRYPPVRKRVDMMMLLDEFSRSLMEEIDYLQEGKNAETFAANFADDPKVCVPAIFWSHTTRRVLTLEEIRAIKITDYAGIEAAGISRVDVAERLFSTYLQQIFEDRFFHADPHPGNLFVLPVQSGENTGQWKLTFVDFGMVGRMSENMMTGLRELLIAVGTQDAPRLIRSYKVLGVLLPGSDVELIEKASAEAFSRFWGRTAPDLASVGHTEIVEFANEFREVLYNMPFQLPENFILLGRCVSILSGICTGLTEDFNFWNEVVPYAKKLVEDERGSQVSFFLRELGDTLRVVASLPKRSENILNRIDQGKLAIQIPELKNQIQRLDGGMRRISTAVLFAALFLAAVQLYLAGYMLPAYLSGAAAGVCLVRNLYIR